MTVDDMKEIVLLIRNLKSEAHARKIQFWNTLSKASNKWIFCFVVFSYIFKCSTVVPTHKSNEKLHTNNYRPFVFDEMLEYIIINSLMKQSSFTC